MNTSRSTAKISARTRAAAAVVFVSLVALSGTVLGVPSAAASSAGQPVAAEERKSSLQTLGKMSPEQLHKAFLATPEAKKALEKFESERLTVGAQMVPASLSKLFGKAFFEGVMKGGGEVAFHAALAAIGVDWTSHQEVAEGLKQLQASLDEMAAQNKAIIDALDGLHKGQQRQHFLVSHGNVVECSNAIDLSMRIIGSWIEDDITLSPTRWTTLWLHFRRM